MPRKKRSLDRDAGVLRDASLIIIASEDTHAVKQYFSRFRPKRVQFVVLPTLDGKSSPDSVVSRIDEFREANATELGDQFWICIDQDHWANSGHIKSLTEVLSRCRQKQIQTAISNPCFELWILLHFDDLRMSDVTAKLIQDRLIELHGGYNKAKCCGSLPFSRENVENAMRRSRALDNGGLIPETPLTRVYLIMNELESRELITVM